MGTEMEITRKGDFESLERVSQIFRRNGDPLKLQPVGLDSKIVLRGAQGSNTGTQPGVSEHFRDGPSTFLV